MKSFLALRRKPTARRTVKSTRKPGTSLRSRLLARLWKQAAARRGASWLSDILLPAPRAGVPAPRPVTANGDGDSASLLGTGTSLAAQLDAIDSPFVQDILVRRAACAMAQLHRAGGYLGHASAEHIEIMGNDVGFADIECTDCDDMSLSAAQTRDWLLFTASVALHYEQRPNDLAAVLFRSTRALSPSMQEHLRCTADELAWMERRWHRLFGRRIKAGRTAVLALRTGFAWQATPASSVHSFAAAASRQRALLRYLDLS
ncbi:hypothetical protein [Dyella sp. C11]|uniref:hypothetical protein n=1 Tax=Dyella sp. C11 TaxID=2126991 RepID=UPI0013001B9E|nr:hypothetical protein [Dyella sp. C11]